MHPHSIFTTTLTTLLALLIQPATAQEACVVEATYASLQTQQAVNARCEATFPSCAKKVGESLQGVNCQSNVNTGMVITYACASELDVEKFAGNLVGKGFICT